jgi:flagellum-specific ATP synthase
MSARLAITAQAVFGAATLAPVSPRKLGKVTASEGLMLEVSGLPMAVGAGVSIDLARGGVMAGEVVGFRDNRCLVLPFSSDARLATGAAVRPKADSNDVAVGEQLLGRIIDANGDPLDGGIAISSAHQWPLGGKPANPLTRGRVTRSFDVGVRAINALLTIGEGQRVAIVAGSGVGKSVLMGQMMAGADCDVIVVGLIGERSREVSDFVETRLPPAVRRKAVVVAVPGDHAPVLRLRAARRATAIAEAFRAEGRRVLLLIDSLTRVAHAQREIGLALGEPPTMKGYPPSVFGLIPALVERAGIDRTTGGSITAFYTVLADGGDIDDPVVDTARAIVDGHIILARSMAEQGVFPAIDLSRSLSRTMTDCASPEHRNAAARFRRLWSLYEENRDLMLMGAYVPGNDADIDEAISRHPEQRAFIGQAADALVPLANSIDHLQQGFTV